MPEPIRDPYQTLGVDAGASDAELHAAYRRMVQLHHPDHNGGSAESARRFEEVQEAYAQIRTSRSTRPRPQAPRAGRSPSGPGAARPGQGAAGPKADPGVESRLAALERELREAHQARERARRDAREAAAAAAAATHSPSRPSDEELGYFSTDDSFSKILSDAAAELSDRFSEARASPAARRVSDLIDELGSKLSGEPPR
jgi:curved DNA-binding protein CbpA